jgi:L-alanine-DL-glutamate epimerase-like enolase superfamily enzyme
MVQATDREDPMPNDRIAAITLSLAWVPLATPISDAKVLTGRQKPLTRVAMLFAEIETEEGHTGLGFSYSKRAGGPGMYAHAREVADSIIGENPPTSAASGTSWSGRGLGGPLGPFDTGDCRHRHRPVGPEGQARRPASGPPAGGMARWRAQLQHSGGFLSSPLEEVLENVEKSIESGIGGIKIKVGHPDSKVDLTRLDAVARQINGRVALMVDANQQWDRPTALRMSRAMEQYGLVWIEEPLDAYDIEGHAALAAAIDTPIASGEMLVSAPEHFAMIDARAVDFIQPDAARVAASPSSSA